MCDESEPLNFPAADSPANKRRIENVEKCFGNAGQPLRSPGRILVGEGILIKACKRTNKPRQFFLFNDILVYGSILIHKKRYTYCNVHAHCAAF